MYRENEREKERNKKNVKPPQLAGAERESERGVRGWRMED